MKFCIAFVCLALLVGSNQARSAEPLNVAGRQTKKIEGWTLLISDELYEKDKAATERALELLTVQLQEIDRVVPAAAVVELRKVPLWFSPEYPKVQPRAEYHPGAGWLRENKRDPAMEKAVEFTNVRTFERETKRMPNFALHELAHAYHDRVLQQGFGNPEIKAAFEKVKAAGLYERVEQRFGDGRSATVRAYAMTTPMEYFAESTEAFFSTNDFFPFNREQLAKHDPQMLELLAKLWDAPAAPAPAAKTDAAQYRDWKHSGSMWLLTTPDGADLPATATVEGFPLLVRLHQDFFDFRQAKANGEDLRFTSSSGERLAYQIEDWDAANGSASVWVRVPKITGNSRQEIKLHWGKTEAASESDGKAVFNESNGFVSVWHMHAAVRDEVGTLPSTDTGTTSTRGMIGAARHFPGGKGVFCGDKIETLPSGASSHSTEAWFRIELPNSTLIGWGNEGGGRGSKVRMQYRGPHHIKIDSDFSDVRSDFHKVTLGQWIHVAHTYDRDDGRIYINGELAGSAKPTLNLNRPSRMWLGGWYHNYDFIGDLDEVRLSSVARSPQWLKLQYENQKPLQSLVGHIVQPGDEFSVSFAIDKGANKIAGDKELIEIDAGQRVMFRAKAGGAQSVQWLQEVLGATDASGKPASPLRPLDLNRLSINISDSTELVIKAVYLNRVEQRRFTVKVRNPLPQPKITLVTPKDWDGRQPIEVVAEVVNLAELKARGGDKFKLHWRVDGVAVTKQVLNDRLVLKRAQGSGTLRVSASCELRPHTFIDVPRVTIAITEPSPDKDIRIERAAEKTEQPEDNQFVAREGQFDGTLNYNGTLDAAADSVFVRLFADEGGKGKDNEKLIKTESRPIGAAKTYALSVKLKAGLIKYRTAFGSKTGDRETVLHSAANIVCGDVFLINGQSNAVATDFGKENPLVPSDWVRTFGATAGDPNGSRLKLWANAEARSPGGKSEIGYWGMELGRRLVESQKMPICVINGAVGGSRIDQHQRNPEDPSDVKTIYGRLLWRVRQAKLDHGVRAVIWHQGENDQGADGPTGGYGYETYRQFFLDLAASWKDDFPNVQKYYSFQIWPKSCSMGVNGSDNRLREVQRTLPRDFSNLSVMSTLGIKPPGGCHFPAEGYAEFARMIVPLVERDLYRKSFEQPVTPANLKRAFFATEQRDELVLEFDHTVVWSDALTSQFHLDGDSKQVASGAATGSRLSLKLKSPSKAKSVTYLDSGNWNPDNLLYGKNGLAALTFCDVPIEDQ